MDDYIVMRLLIGGISSLFGIATLIESVIWRLGPTEHSRAWATSIEGPAPQRERMIVLGAPAAGVMCLSLAACIMPWYGDVLARVAGPLLGVSLAVMIWAFLLPVPRFLWPRWARAPRQQRRQAARTDRPWLRQN